MSALLTKRRWLSNRPREWTGLDQLSASPPEPLVCHSGAAFDRPILRHHVWEASGALPELVLDLGDDTHTALADTRAPVRIGGISGASMEQSAL